MKQHLTPVRMIGIGAAALLLIIIIALTARVGRLNRRVDELLTGLSVELNAQNELTSALEANQRQATGHLSEVRNLLNLSPGAYRFPSDVSDASDEADSTDPQAVQLRQFIAALDRLEADGEIRALELSLSQRAPETLRAAAPAGARVRTDGRLRWRVERQDETILLAAATTSGWQLRSPTGVVVRVDELGAPDSTAALAALQTEAEALIEEALVEDQQWQTTRASIDRALRDAGIAALAAERGLRLATAEQDAVLYRLPFVTTQTREEAFALEVQRSPFAITVDTYEARDVDDAVRAVQERIMRADARTNAQPDTEASIAAIRRLSDNQDFIALLDSQGLTLSAEIRESIDFFYFDIESSDGERVGAYAVQKQLGRIYLTDPFDVVITTLERAGDDPFAELGLELSEPDGPGDRTLPEEFPPGFQAGQNQTDGTSILLIGTHENKADTIILVHLSPEREISMVSIPRDLWWQQRKLSYHNQIFGTPHLIDQMEQILARPIDGWVRVDMYAFIEVVDILGGIEVTLNEPLIDPTYRVREEGEWRTLNYPAGTHQLGGVEALRLARSRHTSNDFERAMRQQQILDALRERLNELNAGSLDRVYQLMETVGEYVDSSYSVWELAQFYLAYRSAPIVNRTGITFDNVLYNTWSNLYLQGLERSEVDESFYLGEWILLPRDDNWSVIPWFVDQNTR